MYAQCYNGGALRTWFLEITGGAMYIWTIKQYFTPLASLDS